MFYPTIRDTTIADFEFALLDCAYWVLEDSMKQTIKKFRTTFFFRQFYTCSTSCNATIADFDNALLHGACQAPEYSIALNQLFSANSSHVLLSVMNAE